MKILATLILLITYPLINSYAAEQYSNIDNIKTKVIVQPKHLLGNYKMTGEITLTTEIIAASQSKIFEVGSFCAFTNEQNGNFPLLLDTEQGGFFAKGENDHKNIPYTLSINNIKVHYGLNQITIKSNTDVHNCKKPETIQIHFSKDAISSAKAGNYAISLNLISR